MEEKESVLKQIRENLRECGFETYYPAQHEGECKHEYVVIAYAGATEILGVSSVADTYNIMCYVPYEKYSRTVEYAGEIRRAMRNIFPLVRETGTAAPAYYDEGTKAYMINLEYANYRQIKYREWR